MENRIEDARVVVKVDLTQVYGIHFLPAVNQSAGTIRCELADVIETNVREIQHDDESVQLCSRLTIGGVGHREGVLGNIVDGENGRIVLTHAHEKDQLLVFRRLGQLKAIG